MSILSERILPFEQARHVVEEHATGIAPGSIEKVDLLESGRRVLAESIHADRDFPPFPRAARDGYALRACDVRQLPTTLEVIGEVRAGADPADIPARIRQGQAVAIMTGAPAPDGADAIVMVEHTSRAGQHVEIKHTIHAGDNIVPLGSEARKGDELLAPGLRLLETSIAVMASVGKAEVRVYARPKVAILSTGDELVGIDAQPGPNQIRNSNSYSLAAQVKAAGGEPILLPVAPDEPKRLLELVETGLRSDLLLIAGGVSLGEYDLVEAIFTELRAEFFFTGAQIQPGRPIVFGRSSFYSPQHSSRKPSYFFGLPGNPVSTMVTFELFVLPMLESLSGMKARKLVFLRARLRSPIQTKPGLKRFLPAILSGEFEDAQVELAPWGGSGDIARTARSNCYVVIGPEGQPIPSGEWVPLLLRP